MNNAVILAAGVTKDTVYAPPKSLFLIDGIPIIVRQICQLREAGVDEIYVVVGYKKEMYFYLEDKHGVTLIGNPQLEKNNIYSLYLARNYLKNTYICACDYYFKDTREAVHQINAVLEQDNFKNAVCLCSLNSNNSLITDFSFDIIDWEFSGYCNIAYDFPFLGNYDFREEDLYIYLTHYYGRKPTDGEYRHWLCYRAYWYFSCWAVYKESLNEYCGNMLLVL